MVVPLRVIRPERFLSSRYYHHTLLVRHRRHSRPRILATDLNCLLRPHRLRPNPILVRQHLELFYCINQG